MSVFAAAAIVPRLPPAVKNVFLSSGAPSRAWLWDRSRTGEIDRRLGTARRPCRIWGGPRGRPNAVRPPSTKTSCRSRLAGHRA